MTLKEKYKKRFPECDIDDVIDMRCPNMYFDVPSMCEVDGGECMNCEECWNREYVDSTVQGLVDGIKKPNPSATEVCQMIAEAVNAKVSTILDSGDRTEFETGAVRDMREGKGRCDLMPLDVVGRLYDNVETKTLVKARGRSEVGSVFICISRFQHDGNVSWLYEALRWAKPFEDKETMFLEVAKHFEEGCKKYGEDNWRKGIPVKCYIDSAVRHYLKFLRGDKDEPHDRAFVWNILCCIWTSNRENSI